MKGNEMIHKKLVIGDRIKFLSICRWNNKTVIRKVKQINTDGTVEVRFGGYGNFIIYNREIIEVFKQ